MMNPNELNTITFDKATGAAALLMILVLVYNAVMAAIKNYREEKKHKSQPMTSMEETVHQHDERLRRDYERLNEFEKRLSELENGNRIMMRAQMALLSHEINGNSDDKLKQSFDEIQQYLINR